VGVEIGDIYKVWFLKRGVSVSETARTEEDIRDIILDRTRGFENMLKGVYRKSVYGWEPLPGFPVHLGKWPY
jgi:hypothetical protein